MDGILADLVGEGFDGEYGVEVLRGVLQSETRDYERYFSPKALDGSITEDIAEVDAEISAAEKRLRELMLENDKEIVTKLLRGDTREKLKSMADLLDQLWEVGTGEEDGSGTARGGTGPTLSGTGIATFDEVLIENGLVDSDATAANSSVQIEGQNGEQGHQWLNSSDSSNLVPVLEQLDSLNELMELPLLARASINTGHYQEAVMLYTYTSSLRSKFTDSSIVDEICKSVLSEIEQTMLIGLVNLLSTNVTINSLKKILTYLSAIPPFNEKSRDSLLIVFLSMRYKFIQKEVTSYTIANTEINDSVVEMMIKRRIEVLREHMYMSLNIFANLFSCERIPLSIPLLDDLIDKEVGDSVVETEQSTEEEITEKTNKNSQHSNEQSTEAEEESKETSEQSKESSEQSKESSEQSKESSEQSKESSEQSKEGKQDKNSSEQSNEDKESIEGKESKEAVENMSMSAQQKNTIPTNVPMLEFISNVIQYTLQDMVDEKLHNKISDSVCLQIVYCSFRLLDLNRNFHHLFLNKVCESELFSADQIKRAIRKRSELASKYS
ncbi:related to Conserved oligomeric Golgi complex subunit 8 [Nakaseomyces glabratus]|nr:related to Conserved oligomeric Golgi complex subunit 8 [Nakaseomyces glabratus]SLM12357.1 related to Conserved oligomeric Golgi complex subunit 8 [Nakaseomyces glabratus]